MSTKPNVSKIILALAVLVLAVGWVWWRTSTAHPGTDAVEDKSDYGKFLDSALQKQGGTPQTPVVQEKPDQTALSKGAQPSAADGERGILESIRQQSSGRIKLVSFEKTNGQKGEFGGIGFYKMEFGAVIQFTDDCRWVRDAIAGCFMTAPLQDKTLLDVKKGQSVRIKGTIQFEQTEKGWRLVSIEL